MKTGSLRPASALLLFAALAGSVFAQAGGLPKLRKNEPYASVRKKMLKSGWKPFRSKDADECSPGDSRCTGRPEMLSCAGTGLGNCAFVWTRKGRSVTIFTVGEEGGIYDGHRFGSVTDLH